MPGSKRAATDHLIVVNGKCDEATFLVGFVIVETPFEYVAVEIVYSPRIGSKLTKRHRVSPKFFRHNPNFPRQFT